LHSTPPLGGGGSRRHTAMKFGTKKLEWYGYPLVKKSKIGLFVLTEITNVTDTNTHTHTDGQTPHDGIGRACTALRGNEVGTLAVDG